MCIRDRFTRAPGTRTYHQYAVIALTANRTQSCDCKAPTSMGEGTYDVAPYSSAWSAGEASHRVVTRARDGAWRGGAATGRRAGGVPRRVTHEGPADAVGAASVARSGAIVARVREAMATGVGAVRVSRDGHVADEDDPGLRFEAFSRAFALSPVRRPFASKDFFTARSDLVEGALSPIFLKNLRNNRLSRQKASNSQRCQRRGLARVAHSRAHPRPARPREERTERFDVFERPRPSASDDTRARRARAPARARRRTAPRSRPN